MDIMMKTYELIDALDSSQLFQNLDFFKEKIKANETLKNLIDKGNRTADEYMLLAIKQELYKYDEYKEYMKIYNEIMYIVMNINNNYKKLFLERMCYK